MANTFGCSKSSILLPCVEGEEEEEEKDEEEEKEKEREKKKKKNYRPGGHNRYLACSNVLEGVRYIERKK